MNKQLIQVVKSIRDQHYPDSLIVFFAGSYIREEATRFSDLDLVVVYESLPNAYRESFRFEGYPVEAFVHDSQTLNYFFLEVDRPSGVPSLPRMVNEGLEIPASTDFSQSLKALASTVLEMGPPLLSTEEELNQRYGITDLLDDIRDPRSKNELVATGGVLYDVLANYYFRTESIWSAKGKSIPRALELLSPKLCKKYCTSFDMLFQKGDASAVISLAEEMLNKNGGLLFEGYKRNAPSEWRKLLI